MIDLVDCYDIVSLLTTHSDDDNFDDTVTWCIYEMNLFDILPHCSLSTQLTIVLIPQ